MFIPAEIMLYIMTALTVIFVAGIVGICAALAIVFKRYFRTRGRHSKEDGTAFDVQVGGPEPVARPDDTRRPAAHTPAQLVDTEPVTERLAQPASAPEPVAVPASPLPTPS